MAIKLSDEQKKAAQARHKDLLVSAAAGAGKTSVLVARILSLITDKDNPVDIDRILVVTFTRAAAGEMRERIAGELSEMLKKDPGNERLIRQSVLLHNAKISTIDSFCTDVIKNYFQDAGLDPVFRVGESGELKLLGSDCMDEMLEEEYTSGGEAFYSLKDTFFSSEKTFRDTITRIYEMSRSMPDPDTWLDAFAGKLHERAGDAEIANELALLAPHGDELVRLVKKYGRIYSAKKREKGIVDFPDLEHFTLRILLNKDENGVETRTHAARELSEHFREIMTDEYQDSNEVQEKILSAIAKDTDGRHDRFMVGDVKQAIYGFRQADPGIFIEKYVTFGKDGNSERIDLHANYRSRRQVINSVNRVFERLMTPETGGISYDESAALVYAADYPESENDRDHATEIFLMDKKDPGFGGAGKEDALRAECVMVAEKILETAGSLDILDRGSGVMRKAGFGDIAVITRNVADCERFRHVFQDLGIPAQTTGRTGYFSSTEVVTVLNYLKILDNPLQDIPFAAVCFSPIGGFSTDEMGQIRAENRQIPWYEACRKYSQDGPEGALKEKVTGFLAVFDALRASVAGDPVHRIIENVFSLTDYMIFAAGMPGGEQRAANLNFLVQKARDFEGTSYHGLFNFIRYIEKLEKQDEDYGDADTTAEKESVQIMTIHKSKGLEFPVVILGCFAKSFSRMPFSDTVLLHKDAGPGFMVIDRLKMKKKKEHKYRESVKERIVADQYAEEMRLLYVAMTRAREKLIITGVFDDLEKSASKCLELGRRHKGALAKASVMGCGSFLEWIIAALAGTDAADPLCSLLSDEKGAEACEDIRIYIETPALSLKKLALEQQKRALKSAENYESAPDAAAARLLEEAGSFRYPKEFLQDMPEKMSVSELKVLRDVPEEEDAQYAPYAEETVIPYIPSFIEKEKKETVTGAARGTVYHYVLEKLDYAGFENCDDAAKEAAGQIEALKDRGLLSEEEAAAVNEKDIAAFVTSPLGRRMAAADARGELKREQPFTFRIPASDVEEQWGDEESILVQGIIDAYFYEEGNIVIVDYKTDYTDDVSGRSLLDKYNKQLYYYKAALEAATQKTVTETYLYAVRLGREIICPL